MLSALAVEGYRSLRQLVVPLAAVTVVTGPNGSGKSSLYRALRLLAAAARDGAVAALAREGGLPSTLWAGPETIGRAMREGWPTQGTVRKGPVSLRLGFGGDGFGYAIDFGLPTPAESSMFGRDPEIKAESAWSGPLLRPGTLLSERRGPRVRLRDGAEWRVFERALPAWASMLSEVGDPVLAPELLALRDALRGWRFYDHVRTDDAAPARGSIVGTRTPVLAADGSDLPAALRTIVDREAPGRSTRPSTALCPAVAWRSRIAGAASPCCCGNPGCCVRSRSRSCPTGLCAICSGSPRC